MPVPKVIVKARELGKKRILGKLGKFPYVIGMSARKITKDAAEAIARKARENAPILKQIQQVQTHPGLTRGALKQSIRAERGRGGYIIGSDLPYAYFVELGVDHPGATLTKPIYFWSEREGRFKYLPAGYTIRPHRIRAQPFMRPALQWGEKQGFLTGCAYLSRDLKRWMKG